MNISEIRVGNILKAKENGRWNTVVVSATFQTFIIAKNRFLHIGNAYDPHQIHGAYFSTDWLLENGFEDIGNGKDFYLPNHTNHYINLTLRTKDNGNSFTLIHNVNGIEKVLGSDIRSIHTLQNIYFAITRAELLSEQETTAVLAVTAPMIDQHTESDQ